MGDISKWLMHDDQKELFEILCASVLTVAFLALVALLLWPPGKLALTLHLAKGYGILWVVTFLSAAVVHRTQRFFKVNMYDHPDAYVLSNLGVSCFLQVGWSAFAALTLYGFVADTTVWVAIILYLVGTLSCLIAYFVVTSFYYGHIYKLISLPLALVSFAVFSVWPAVGRAIYGWFFDLF